MERLGWQDTRITSGADALEFGRNNSGRGVGGGTTHFTGVFLRFHESDFMTYTMDGVGVDWPLRYEDLAPYYDWIDQDIGVSGPRHFPWGPFRGPYPLPEREPISANAQVFRRGCEALGFERRGRAAGHRQLAVQWAAAVHQPGVLQPGLQAQLQVQHPHSPYSEGAAARGGSVVGLYGDELALDRKEERVTGVVFHHDGAAYLQRARVVVLSTFVVETPRLLLNQTSRRFPHGLANTSGGWQSRHAPQRPRRVRPL